MNRHYLGWLAAKAAIAILLPVLFILAQLGVFYVMGGLVDWWFFDNNPDWYEGPLGGIHQLPVFFVAMPFALWLAFKIWRRIGRRLEGILKAPT